MTARIYTIPAREVVPGMVMAGCDCKADHTVASVSVRGHHVQIAFVTPGLPSFDYSSQVTVSVTLPGPSPRELLCSCCERDRMIAEAAGEPFDAEALQPDCHEADCPVYRLRLRLWPVGATWTGERWEIPCTRTDDVVVSLPVYPGHVIQALAHRGEASAALRAAFCEPEVQP